VSLTKEYIKTYKFLIMESEKLTLADLGKPILTIDALKEEEMPVAATDWKAEKCSLHSSTASEENPVPVSLTGEKEETDKKNEPSVSQVDQSDECGENVSSNVETSRPEQADTVPHVEPIEVTDQETQVNPEPADGAEVQKIESTEPVRLNVEEPAVRQVDPCDECGKNNSSNVQTSGSEQIEKTVDAEAIEVTDDETQVNPEPADGAEVQKAEESKEPVRLNAEEMAVSQVDLVEECSKHDSPNVDTSGSGQATEVHPELADGTEVQKVESTEIVGLNVEEANDLDNNQNMVVSNDGIDHVKNVCMQTRPEEQTMPAGEIQEASRDTKSSEKDIEPATEDETNAQSASDGLTSSEAEEKVNETMKGKNYELKELSKTKNDESENQRKKTVADSPSTTKTPFQNEAKPESTPADGECADINANIDVTKSTWKTHSAHEVSEAKETEESQKDENKAVGGTSVRENCLLEQTISDENSGLEVDVTTSAIDKDSKDINENNVQTKLHDLTENATTGPEEIPETKTFVRVAVIDENNSSHDDMTVAKEKQEGEPLLMAPHMNEEKPSNGLTSSPENSIEALDKGATEEESGLHQTNKDSAEVDNCNLHNSRPEPDGYRPDPSEDDSCLRQFTESNELAAKVDNAPHEKETDSLHSSKPDPPPDPPEVLRIEISFHDEPSNYDVETENRISEAFQVEEKTTEYQIEQATVESQVVATEEPVETKDSNNLPTDESKNSKCHEEPTKVEQTSKLARSDQTRGPYRKEIQTAFRKFSEPSSVSKDTSPQIELEEEYEEEIIDESEVSYEEFVIDDESEVDDYFEEVIEDDDLFTEETYNSNDENDTDYVTAGTSTAPLAEGRRTVSRTKSADELGRRSVVRSKSTREKELENEIARKREEAMKFKKDVEYRIARQNSFAEKDFDFLRKLAEEEAEHIREEEERERKRREQEADMARIKAEEAALLIAQQEKEELRKRLMEEEERRKAIEAEAHRLAAERAAKEKEALEKARREFEEEERRKREEKKKEMEAEVRVLQAKLEEAKRAAIEAKKKQKEEKERLRAKVDARRKTKKEKAPANSGVPKSPEKSTITAVVEMASPGKLPTPALVVPESPMKTTSMPAPRSPSRSPKKVPTALQLPESTPVTTTPVVAPAPPSPKKAPVAEKSPVVAPPQPKAPTKENSPSNSPPASSEPTEYYTVEQLRKQTVPGLDYKNREKYLSPEDFQSVLGVTKAEFETFPKWKQTNLKRKNKLF
jgi:hypothetical protein